VKFPTAIDPPQFTEPARICKPNQNFMTSSGGTFGVAGNRLDRLAARICAGGPLQGCGSVLFSKPPLLASGFQVKGS
jgi:hypothetical protein